MEVRRLLLLWLAVAQGAERLRSAGRSLQDASENDTVSVPPTVCAAKPAVSFVDQKPMCQNCASITIDDPVKRCMFNTSQCENVGPGQSCEIDCALPFVRVGNVTTGQCATGNSIPDRMIVWQEPMCICPEPASQQGYVKEGNVWRCSQGFAGTPQVVCEPLPGCQGVQSFLQGCEKLVPCAMPSVDNCRFDVSRCTQVPPGGSCEIHCQQPLTGNHTVAICKEMNTDPLQELDYFPLTCLLESCPDPSPWPVGYNKTPEGKWVCADGYNGTARNRCELGEDTWVEDCSAVAALSGCMEVVPCLAPSLTGLDFCTYDVSACTSVAPGEKCEVHCKNPFTGAKTEADCPVGNTDPNGLMWTMPPCTLESCDEPGTVPAGYRRSGTAWECAQSYTGFAEKAASRAAGCAPMSTPQIPASLWQKAARALMSDEKKEDDGDAGPKQVAVIPPKFGAPAPPPIPVKSGMAPPMPIPPKANMALIPAKSGMSIIPAKSGMGGGPMPSFMTGPAPSKDDDDDDSDEESSEEDGAAPNPMMMLMMLKQMQNSVKSNMSKAPPEMQEQQKMLLQMQQQFEMTLMQKMGMESGGSVAADVEAVEVVAVEVVGVVAAAAAAVAGVVAAVAVAAVAAPKSALPAALANKQKMDASSNLMSVASSASSSAQVMPQSNMGLPAAQAMAASGATPEMLQMMQQMMGVQSGYVDPSQKGAVEAQQEALALAAKELQAAQEAAAAQQQALEAMSPEQRDAVLKAMSAASEAQQAQQSQFYEAMKAHEMEKLQKSGYYQSNQPERFKDGYRPLRMCKHYKTDQCWRGQECTYAHSLEELHPASPDLPRVEVKETNALAEQQKVEDSAPDVRLKKKKELCNKWKNGQDCVLGRACPYAHGEKELGTVELVVCGRVKTRICKFWTTGNCMFLGNCVNAHGEKELGTKRPDFMTPPMKKRREGESIDQFREQVISQKGGKGFGKGRH
ncbi:unnamed protein product [Effrenium voratum]|nr:unnamed protein product [Effrenium voratum]